MHFNKSFFCDAVPTSNQQWVNVSRLLGMIVHYAPKCRAVHIAPGIQSVICVHSFEWHMRYAFGHIASPVGVTVSIEREVSFKSIDLVAVTCRHSSVALSSDPPCCYGCTHIVM